MTLEVVTAHDFFDASTVFMRDLDPEKFPKHEPEPDSPDPQDPGPEDDVADLVRPIKT